MIRITLKSKPLVSEQAMAVWKYYATKRDDIAKSPFPRQYAEELADQRKHSERAEKAFKERPDYLKLVYSKPNPDYLQKLLTAGKVRSQKVKI